jgi:hypothetical protein
VSGLWGTMEEPEEQPAIVRGVIANNLWNSDKDTLPADT